LPNGNHHVSGEPSTTGTVSPNPTPRTSSSTHRIESRYVREIEPLTLSEVLSFGFWMQKTGYRPSTVKTCIRSLKAVARRTRLLDPESVKGYLATAKVSVNRKQTVTEHLSRFYKWKRIPFQVPHYKKIETIPFIPSETEVDQLIAGTSSRIANLSHSSRSCLIRRRL
jgi:hypothetical protein